MEAKLYEVSVKFVGGDFNVYVVAGSSEHEAELTLINFLGSEKIDSLQGATEVQPFAIL